MTSAAGSIPPFRAEHIGSLLRPPELIQAHRSLAAHQLTAEGFREVREKLIRDVIRLQEEAGLQSITDGEFRRGSYFSHFIEGMTGITDKEAVFHFTRQSGQTLRFNAPHVVGKLKREQGISTEEFLFLQANTRRTPKSPCRRLLRYIFSVAARQWKKRPTRMKKNFSPTSFACIARR